MTDYSSCFDTTDAQIERPYRVQSLYVRCVKSYSIVVLTGTDARRLDTLERPYRLGLQRLMSGIVVLT